MVVLIFVCCTPAFASDDLVPVAYTSNPLSRTVSVIDMRDNSIFATIYDVNSSAGLAISPDGKWLYVANPEANSVTYINMTRSRVSDTIPVGDTPYGVAMAPDGGTVYVTNYWDNTVSIIDTRDKKVTDTISVGKGPYGIKMNPVTGEAYVINSDDGTISVIRGKSVVATITAGDHTTRGLAVTPDGGRILVVNRNNNTVSAINATTYEIMNTVNVGLEPTGIAVSPDGWYAFVTNPGSGNISDMLISDNSIRVSFGFNNSSLIAFKPDDGRTAYVITMPRGEVKVIDSATGAVNATIGVRAEDIVVAMVSDSMLVDNTPPETMLNLYGEQDENGKYIGKVVCNLTAVDYPSGVEQDNIGYSFTGMGMNPYEGNFTLSSPGRFIVYYRSIDKYGNEEWPKSKVIRTVAGPSAQGPAPSPTMRPANGSIWTGPQATDIATPPQASAMPKPSAGFEAVLAVIGMMGAVYYLRRE